LNAERNSDAASPSPEALLRQAAALHSQGSLGEAEALYRRVLALAPHQFDALHLLGVVCHQKGRHAEAIELIDAAIAVDAGQAPAHSNRGLVLAGLGRLDEALASFDRALALQGAFTDALLNRGNVQAGLGRNADALASFDAALALRPGDVRALLGRGNALAALGRRDDALAAYDAALATGPATAGTLNNRGNVLLELGRVDEALASYEGAIAAGGAEAVAHCNRAKALAMQDRFADALASCDRALAMRPEYPEALLNRSNALLRLGRAADALASCDRALELAPNDAQLHFNRGVALADLGDPRQASASFTRALESEPSHARALERRAMARSSLGEFEGAAADMARALELDPLLPYARGAGLQWRLQCCDWAGIEAAIADVVAGVRSGERVVAPFTFIAVSASPADQLRCARVWVSRECPPAAEPLWRGETYDHDRIRVAYLSSDFREHPIVYKLAGVIERHDTARFETIGVAFGPDVRDAARQRMERAFERFLDAHAMRDEAIAAWLRDEEVDIVVDLNGFTKNARSRILASRPAPVQVNYFGYPATMGAGFIDYILADRFVIPESQRHHYAEAVVDLPDTFHPTDDSQAIGVAMPSRETAGLPPDALVLCCFNNDYKIQPAQFDTWMRILARTERSVLWLLEGSATVEANLRREAAARGVDPARLVFARRVAYETYLARYRLADLFLDTLPFNAAATASDALWAGVPVLTCAGDAYASRISGSLLRAIGLSDLVATSLGEYEAIACRLAADAQALRAIRERLAVNRSRQPLFDTDRFRRHLEAAFTTMCERYRRGERAAPFAVAPIG
jgi:predicted O-linked N-acetylglucosamine transferase (SPINDLY family)